MFGQSLLSAFGSAVACTTDTDQLFATDVQTTSLATYQLNNATTSIPSNTYPGSASNITYAAGKFGNAAVFNGSNSSISLGSTIDDPLRTAGAFGTSMWFKTPSGGQVNSYGGKLISLLDNIYLFINIQTNNTLLARVGQSNGTQREFTTSALSASTWYHIVFTGNSSNGVTLYLNGSSQGNLSWDGTFDTYTNPGYKFNYLGYQGSGVSYLTGTLDQVRIFNSALPQAAVTALYNETTTTATYDYVEYEGANPNSVAYYKMSNAADQLGNYNGTATNVNFNTVGKFGFAGAFNGTSSSINLNSAVLPANNFSVSMWINTSALGDQQYIITQYELSGTNAGRFILYLGTTGFLNIQVGSNGSFFGSALNTGTWYHLALVKTTTWECYLNGVSIGTWSDTANITTTRNTQIGSRESDSAQDQWNGSIDQVRIYDSALSAANVTTLYEEIECPAVAVTNAFNTVLYTGDDTNTSYTRNVTGVGFKPDFIWIKSRDYSGFEHALFDSVRGAGASKILSSDTTGAEGWTSAGPMSAFITDGFSIQPRSPWNSNNLINKNGDDFVSWNWKAAGFANTFNVLENGTVTTSGSAATAGITSGSDTVGLGLDVWQVSANRDAGFSIVNYKNTSGDGAVNVGHGLNQEPDMIIQKSTNSSAIPWVVYHREVGTGKYLSLNSTSTPSTSANVMSLVDSTSFSSNWSNTAYEFINYCFVSIPGYSRVGSYIGNGSTTGPIIYTGFRPRFIMTRPYSIGDNWSIWGVNQSGDDIDQILVPNNAGAQSAIGFGRYDITLSSTGFQLKRTDSQINQNGAAYIFMAIA